MVTRVYAAGVKATAIANIKADIAGYISTNANGEQVLDTDGLRTYLETQFQLISTTPEYVAPATAETSMTAALSAPAASLVANLNAQIYVGRWSSRSDWPTSVSVLAGGTMVSAVKAGLADLKRLADAVTAHYANINSSLFDLITEYYYGAGIDAAVPAGIVPLRDTRYYIQTFVTDKGEESGPSPVSLPMRPDQNDTVTVSRVAAPVGRTEITYCRMYRSNSGFSGDAFQLIPNPADANGWPIATSNAVDDMPNTGLQGTCRTLTWSEPPSRLQGIIAGENGGGAGFTGNDWCPWVNNFAYAFRVQDRKHTEHPIVAQGVFGNTYVVLTRGHPYYITGIDAAAMSSEPRRDGQPCMTGMKGVVSMSGVVVYPSPDGLCVAGPNGFKIITGPAEQGGFDLFSQEDWQALNPATIFAVENEGCYVFSFGTAGAVYSLNLSTGKLTTLEGITASAFHRDALTDTLYAASGATIKACLKATARRTAVWESKDIMMGNHPSMGWLRVRSDFSSGGSPATVTVKYYGNDVLIHTKALSSRKPVKVPPGKFDRIKVRVESTARITDLTLCTNTEELRQS